MVYVVPQPEPCKSIQPGIKRGGEGDQKQKGEDRHKWTVLKMVAGERPPLPHHHFTYPLTAWVVGVLWMTSLPVLSIFLCSPLPSWTGRPS